MKLFRKRPAATASPTPAVSIPPKSLEIPLSREQKASLHNPLDPRVNAMLQKPAPQPLPTASKNDDNGPAQSDPPVNMLDGL